MPFLAYNNDELLKIWANKYYLQIQSRTNWEHMSGTFRTIDGSGRSVCGQQSQSIDGAFSGRGRWELVPNLNPICLYLAGLRPLIIEQNGTRRRGFCLCVFYTICENTRKFSPPPSPHHRIRILLRMAMRIFTAQHDFACVCVCMCVCIQLRVPLWDNVSIWPGAFIFIPIRKWQLFEVLIGGSFFQHSNRVKSTMGENWAMGYSFRFCHAV